MIKGMQEVIQVMEKAKAEAYAAGRAETLSTFASAAAEQVQSDPQPEEAPADPAPEAKP